MIPELDTNDKTIIEKLNINLLITGRPPVLRGAPLPGPLPQPDPRRPGPRLFQPGRDQTWLAVYVSYYM